MSDGKDKPRAHGDTEKTVIRSLALDAVSGGRRSGAVVDVKNGRIVRIRPLRYDLKYKREELNPWKFKRISTRSMRLTSGR